MITIINEHIKIWQAFNPAEISISNYSSKIFNIQQNPTLPGYNKERISINNRWFDVLSPSKLVRMRNSKDGFFRVIYIQINWETGEYYIGKANRPTWSQLKHYQGSGLKFTNKLKAHKDKFQRFYIAKCETAEETEQLEASIVNKALLSDEKCLNLVVGGGGTSYHPTIAETSEKKRQYMKNHPEQFQAMLEGSKRAFRSGDTAELRARSRRIKEVMSGEKYRDGFRKRLNKWRTEHPEQYHKARKKNHEAISDPIVQKKRQESFKKWAKENPEKYIIYKANLIKSHSSDKARNKRKASLKAWKEKHPEEAHTNAVKRARAAAAKTSKAVCMIDLLTGNTIITFPSQHAAAKWLVVNGKAKNMNCVSSINSVCLQKPCTTGYGFRKKAYGYKWRFSSEIKKSSYIQPTLFD
jgi:hypothetical protein